MKDWLITREIYFSFLNVKWSQSIYLFLRINALSGENNFVHASHRWSTWPLNTLKIKKLKHPFSSQPFTNLSINISHRAYILFSSFRTRTPSLSMTTNMSSNIVHRSRCHVVVERDRFISKRSNFRPIRRRHTRLTHAPSS